MAALISFADFRIASLGVVFDIPQAASGLRGGRFMPGWSSLVEMEQGGVVGCDRLRFDCGGIPRPFVNLISRPQPGVLRGRGGDGWEESNHG